MTHQRHFSTNRFHAALAHFAVGRLAQAFLTLVQMLVVVRLFEGDTYGLYMIVWGLLEFAVPLTSAGVLPAAQRYVPELAENGTPSSLRSLVRTVFAWRVVFVLIGSALIVGCWQWIANLGRHVEVDATFLFAVFAVIVTNMLARFAAELLEALLDQKHAQFQRALLAAGRLAVLGVLWSTGDLSLTSLLLAEALVAAVAWMAGEIWLRTKLKQLRPRGTRELESRELWQFIRDMAGSQFLNATANVGLLRLVVAQAAGVVAAGQFAFVQQLVVIGQRYLPSVLLANLVRPMLVSRYAGGAQADVATSLGLLWKTNVMLSWPLVPAAVIAGDLAVGQMSGGRFPTAGWLLALLLVGLAATAQTQILAMAMQVQRQTTLARNLSWLALSAAPLTWLGSQQGLLGAAAGASGSLALRAVVSLRAVQRGPSPMAADHTGVGRFLMALLFAVICGAGSTWAWGPAPGAGAFAVALVIGSLLARPLSADEGHLLVRLFGRRGRWLAAWSR